MPYLVDRFRGCVLVFPDQAVETHADHVAGFLLGDLDHLGVNGHDIGFLRGVAALGDVHADLGKHLGGGEFTDIVKVPGIVGRLQSNEAHFGVAHEAGNVEVGRDVAAGARRWSGTGSRRQEWIDALLR